MSAPLPSAVAPVFPGQGSQRAGMLAVYQGYPAVADAVSEVSDVIGADLAAMIENDGDALNQTINTQPAMLAMGVGVYRAARALMPPPLCFAGHSLGEYSALVCAGALTLADAARLVRRRAALMQNAVPDGGMAALLGLSAAQADAVCAGLREDGQEVWAANYNTESQIVIAGRRAAVARAIDAAKAAGAKRALMLPMSAPSHCPLLAAAAEEFAADLAAVNWQPPAAPVLHSAAAPDGEDVSAPPVARLLALQLTQPIRWQQILAGIAAAGAGAVIECGPGKVLAGLGKKSALPHIALDDAAAIAALAA